MTRLRLIVTTLVLAVLALPLSPGLHASDRDSIPTDTQQYKFSGKQLITPGTMLAVGIVGSYTFDSFRHDLQSVLTGTHCHTTQVDEFLQFVPAAAYLTVGFIPGVEKRYGFKERLLGGFTAFVVATAATEGFKLAFQRVRPDGTGDDSFPSGHSARAFAGAELMRIEYGNLVGLAGYTCAIATGILRIHNNRHWWCDVMGGAAIGILSARIAYWLLPWEQRLFGLNKKSTTYTNSGAVSQAQTSFLIVTPTPMPGGAGISLNYTF